MMKAGVRDGNFHAEIDLQGYTLLVSVLAFEEKKKYMT
jgi:hypothetical protein